jgi:DNA-binding PadR family transcriptional regulator
LKTRYDGMTKAASRHVAPLKAVAFIHPMDVHYCEQQQYSKQSTHRHFERRLMITIYLDFRYIAIYIGSMTDKLTHGQGPMNQSASDDERRHGHHRHKGRHGGGRLLDYGELRILVLAMISEQPRHGYELMRALEERTSGAYNPSPGVIYPTLAWLEDMGYTQVEAEGGRKSYRITAEGEAFYTSNRGMIDRLFARISSAGGDRRHGEPAPVTRGMENLKMALRLRLKSGPLDPETADKIAAALDAAALAVERA